MMDKDFPYRSAHFVHHPLIAQALAALEACSQIRSLKASVHVTSCVYYPAILDQIDEVSFFPTTEERQEASYETALNSLGQIWEKLNLYQG